MKFLLLVTALVLAGCAPAPHQSTAWTMSWTCNQNLSCAQSMGAWNGNGSFASESDCLAWETGFLNSFGGTPGYSNHDSVTSCTGN